LWKNKRLFLFLKTNIKNCCTEQPAMMLQNQTTQRTAHKTQSATWLCIDFDSVDYSVALDLQHRLVAARKSKVLEKDILLVLEHPPVFTLGRRGGRENLRVSSDFLEKSGIQVIQVERGGNITYHGPGQLVVYFISDLNATRMGVDNYVSRLEEVMLRIAADWNVPAERNDANRGIWVGNNKMGSIGIAIRRGVTFHGLALNANPSLEPFCWINPCGMQNIGMTSIQQESAHSVSMPQVRQSFKLHFTSVFGAKLVETTLEDVKALVVDSQVIARGDC
jgi:lipoate-protein ligase B